MAKYRSSSSRTTPQAAPRLSTEPVKYENIHALGGIQTGALDAPFAGGLSHAARVAFVNTGAGLRFTVALDRGGDIVEAAFNQHNLAFLTANGYKTPSPAYHREEDWLDGWPGGLVTTCGPLYIGGPRDEDGQRTSLHGHYSNTPATVETVLNPDPRNTARPDRLDMLLSLVVRDTRMYGPVVECRRQIRCTLGQPLIRIRDTVTNRGDAKVPHHWLYHVNLGFPLLDEGARLVYAGRATSGWDAVEGESAWRDAAYRERIKTVPDPLPSHAGSNARGVILDAAADRDGVCHVGLVNPRLGLAFELEYPRSCLPRLANWQHYGPAGCYVSGVEPFSGSLLGKNRETHPLAEQWLQPGESKRYDLTIRVHSNPDAVKAFLRQDGKVTA